MLLDGRKRQTLPSTGAVFSRWKMRHVNIRGGGHRGGRRSAKQTDREESGADNLRRRGRERPERRRAGQEPKELLDHVGAKTVDIHDFVDAVVNHQGARPDT